MGESVNEPIIAEHTALPLEVIGFTKVVADVRDLPGGRIKARDAGRSARREVEAPVPPKGAAMIQLRSFLRASALCFLDGSRSCSNGLPNGSNG